MSYPPGSPGYPPSQQPTTQFSAPTQQFGKVPDAAGDTAAGPNKLPSYLLLAAAVLGLLSFLLNAFAPVFEANVPTEYENIPGIGGESGTTEGMTLAVAALLLAGLFAAVATLPKQRNYTALVAVVSVLGFLLILTNMFQKPDNVDYGWALWLILIFALLQTGAAVTALLFDSGIVTPPAPKPKYDQQQQQFGQYGAPGGYYGGPQQHPGQQQLPQQRPGGYPTQYGGGYPGQPTTGGFQAGGPQGGSQSGPPTPPTGFPTYGQPQQPTSQNPGQQQSPSSQQSGPAPS